MTLCSSPTHNHAWRHTFISRSISAHLYILQQINGLCWYQYCSIIKSRVDYWPYIMMIKGFARFILITKRPCFVFVSHCKCQGIPLLSTTKDALLLRNINIVIQCDLCLHFTADNLQLIVSDISFEWSNFFVDDVYLTCHSLSNNIYTKWLVRTTSLANKSLFRVQLTPICLLVLRPKEWKG